jgi:Transmembrane domain of unknown function (DUF3566)
VEHRAEPASWLPEGTTPDLTAAGADATAQLPDPGEDVPYVPKQDGPYSYGNEGAGVHGLQGSYGKETVSEGPYNPSPGTQHGDDHHKLRYQSEPSPDPSTLGGAAGYAPPVGHAPPPVGHAPPPVGQTPSAAGQAPFTSYRAGAKARPTGRPAAVPARRANLIIARLEPWSVMKFSFLMSLVAWVVLFVAVALLYYALAGLGVFNAIERAFQGVTASQGSSGVDLNRWLSASRVLGYTMLIGAMNVVLITALSTVGAVIYNLVSYLGRGIEITLKEPE